MKKNVKAWTSNSRHQGVEYRRKGVGTYRQDIELLLKTESPEVCCSHIFTKVIYFESLLMYLQTFEHEVNRLSQEWGPKFLDYFNGDLRTDLLTKACRWVVDSVGLYNNWSGITSNACESINAVLAREFPDGPVAMDEAVLQLYHVVQYYNFELNRGFCSMGNRLLTQ